MISQELFELRKEAARARDITDRLDRIIALLETIIGNQKD